MSGLKRILCAKIPEPHRPTELAETEATHATRVLRLKDGDLVEAMDGKGHAALAKLRTRNGPPRLEFHEKTSQSSASQLVPVTLEMAVLKGDAMEWVVEKAVELGITRLIPVLTAHTVVQMDRKGPEAFRERWQKIADQALKQCGRLEALRVEMPVALDELLTSKAQGMRLWCDEEAREDSARPSLLKWLEENRQQGHPAIHLLIGPEGGWSDSERDLLSREDSSKLACVSLGPLVLRAETAAIAALSLVASDFRVRG
jgi:16S rRNA (uracil1498-N3)-methyltransferase